jgi:hypothetical protein
LSETRNIEHGLPVVPIKPALPFLAESLLFCDSKHPLGHKVQRFIIATSLRCLLFILLSVVGGVVGRSSPDGSPLPSVVERLVQGVGLDCSQRFGFAYLMMIADDDESEMEDDRKKKMMKLK